MSFFDTFKHLLPRAAAWRITIEKTLRRFFEGLAGAPEDARAFVDDVHDDLYPETTRELAKWEGQFGLATAGTDAARRANVLAAWQATGGQSPRYLQDIVQAAGFPLFVHEWWVSGPPYVARDPRDYTEDPLTGSVQCGEPLAQCGEPSAQCNNFLVNWPHYIVNLDLTRRAPPLITDDEDTWPYFLYFGPENLDDDPIGIPVSRRSELEQLLLQIRPAQQWIVLRVEYAESETRVTLQGDRRVTLQGDVRITLGGISP